MSDRRPRKVRNERDGMQMAKTATTDTEDEPASTPAGEHVYLHTHQVSGDVLRFLLSFERSRPQEVAPTSPSGQAGKGPEQEGSLRVVQMALKEDAGLSSHDVDGAVSVQILRGHLQICTAGGAMDLTPGALVVLDASVRHSATTLRIVPIALKEGVRLSSHDVDCAVSVQILRGSLRICTAGAAMDLTPGALVVLDASVRHSATALTDCELLITISLREDELP